MTRSPNKKHRAPKHDALLNRSCTPGTVAVTQYLEKRLELQVYVNGSDLFRLAFFLIVVFHDKIQNIIHVLLIIHVID
jgi:hypothetical protein